MLMRCLRFIAALLVTATAACAGPAWSATAATAASAVAASHPTKENKPAAGTAATGSLAVMFDKLEQRNSETSTAIRYVIVLTVAALIPSLLICMTAFLRIAIVLSMLRHAIGMPETPPNAVLIGLALFLTLFTMAPVLQTVNTQALQPFMNGSISIGEGLEKGGAPLREFMIRQTREADLALMVELSKAPPPSSIDDIGNLQLIPAFMLSELRAAFQIGFVIFLPFLLIDLIVSSILMSLGMMMMPPITIALPIKILMFILVDGWAVIVKALVGSFH
jgi:flagellar biosynthesis protein FliP